MKIDFDALEKLAASGATANVLIQFLRLEDAKRTPKRERDRNAKRAKPKRKEAKASESARNDATLDDSPRARLFREGSDILATLGRSDRGARGLLSQWLKLTHDDCQLIMASLLRARELGVADVAGWMLNTLNGKVKNGTAARTLATAGDDLIARTAERSEPADFGAFDFPARGG